MDSKRKTTNKLAMLKNIFSQQCPRCRQGKLFLHQAYNLKSFAKMPEKCPNCNLRYELEPSFFYGALYISYALQVAIFTTVSVAISVLVEDAPLSWYMAGVGLVAVLLLPLVLRLSRSIWIHIFVKYDQSYDSKMASQV